MSLPKLPIRDHIFSHAKSTSGWLKPTYFEWDFNGIPDKFIFLTDHDVFAADAFTNVKRFAWLVESPVITPQSYKFVQDNYELFDVVFTHDDATLKCPNAKFLPIGMCHLQEDEIGLKYQKTKLVSMMYSNKNFAPGHTIRHAVAQEFNEIVDLMGSGATGQHVKKIESCRNHMFSIAIENCRQDSYFSEKLLDCFLTGTIPIYWGMPSISKFFNHRGFFSFTTLEQLYDILKDQEDLYHFYMDNQHFIQENYERALKYKIAEDRLWLDYNKFLTE